MNDEARPSGTFSISRGGPFYELARRVHLVAPSGAMRIWLLVAIGWVPLVLDAVIHALAGARIDPIVFDMSVHARLLIGIPLLLASERLLEVQCGAVVRQLYTSQLADPDALDAVIARGERMRDNVWVEGTAAVLALTAGQLVLWGVIGPTGVFHGIEHAELSITRVWYATIAFPLLQFLLLRWVWHWVIWTIMLVRISRLPLAVLATHPDRACGLRFLSGPVTGFAVFELAFAWVLAGAWGTQLLEQRVTVPSLLPTIFAFLLIAIVISCGPLLLFTPQLYRGQRRALVAYNPFAFGYVRDFHAKWIEGRTEPSPLGTSDIQSLADLANAYQTIEGTGMFVFSKRKLLELWLAAFIPILPLVLTLVPLEQLLRRMGSVLLGIPL